MEKEVTIINKDLPNNGSPKLYEAKVAEVKRERDSSKIPGDFHF